MIFRQRLTSPLQQVFLCLLFSLAGCSTAQLRTTSNALLVADWAQTRYIAAHPDQYRELNPTIGEHPSTGTVNTHFVTALAINNAVFYALNEEHSRWWSMAIIGLEGTMVAHNAAIGIKLNW